jgi:hypothetical protein
MGNVFRSGLVFATVFGLLFATIAPSAQAITIPKPLNVSIARSDSSSPTFLSWQTPARANLGESDSAVIEASTDKKTWRKVLAVSWWLAAQNIGSLGSKYNHLRVSFQKGKELGLASASVEIKKVDSVTYASNASFQQGLRAFVDTEADLLRMTWAAPPLTSTSTALFSVPVSIQVHLSTPTRSIRAKIPALLGSKSFALTPRDYSDSYRVLVWVTYQTGELEELDLNISRSGALDPNVPVGDLSVVEIQGEKSFSCETSIQAIGLDPSGNALVATGSMITISKNGFLFNSLKDVYSFVLIGDGDKNNYKVSITLRLNGKSVTSSLEIEEEEWACLFPDEPEPKPITSLNGLPTPVGVTLANGHSGIYISWQSHPESKSRSGDKAMLQGSTDLKKWVNLQEFDWNQAVQKVTGYSTKYLGLRVQTKRGTKLGAPSSPAQFNKLRTLKTPATQGCTAPAPCLGFKDSKFELSFLDPSNSLLSTWNNHDDAELTRLGLAKVATRTLTISTGSRRIVETIPTWADSWEKKLSASDYRTHYSLSMKVTYQNGASEVHTATTTRMPILSSKLKPMEILVLAPTELDASSNRVYEFAVKSKIDMDGVTCAIRFGDQPPRYLALDPGGLGSLGFKINDIYSVASQNMRSITGVCFSKTHKGALPSSFYIEQSLSRWGLASKN